MRWKGEGTLRDILDGIKVDKNFGRVWEKKEKKLYDRDR